MSWKHHWNITKISSEHHPNIIGMPNLKSKRSAKSCHGRRNSERTFFRGNSETFGEGSRIRIFDVLNIVSYLYNNIVRWLMEIYFFFSFRPCWYLHFICFFFPLESWQFHRKKNEISFEALLEVNIFVVSAFMLNICIACMCGCWYVGK